MIENVLSFQNKENINLVYHEWLPDGGNIRAVVLILHGHGEHSGRYRHVAESLTEVGFACYGIDHRGHGKSSGTRIFISDMAHSADDVYQLFNKLKKQYSNKLFHVYGHSMGSLIALQFVLQHQSEINALVLSGTAITGDETQPAWLVSLAIKAAKFIPKIRLSPPLSPTLLTTDANQIKLWLADPLTDKGMWRIATSAAMLTAGKNIRDQVHNLTLPMLVLHGEDDALTPPTGATYLKDHVQSNDITVKVYPGLRHELVNEVGREEIIQTITDWLVAHS